MKTYNKNINVKLIQLNVSDNGITFTEMIREPFFKGLCWVHLNKF